MVKSSTGINGGESIIRNQEDVKSYLRNDEQMHFDFSQAPTLIRRLKEKNTLETEVFRKEDMSRWVRAQKSFLCWINDKKVFTKQYIESGITAYNAFFKERGCLQGNILDIGGGWGLFRQWWEPGESDVFIVHDPGVERFLRGPYKLHHHYYQRAFSLPMTFVEGFGEELPYKNDIFDTCLIAATLDHCIYPHKLCAEAYRCLRPGGTILVMQSCGSSEFNSHRPHILKRLLKHLRHPKRGLPIIYDRLFHASYHLHHFYPADITLLLEQVAFSKIRTSIVPTTQDVWAFEAIKEPLDIT